jgi:hypothetical protein
MNTRTPLESPNATVVLSISFNDDCSCFAVGLSTGFRSESLRSLDFRSVASGIYLQHKGKQLNASHLDSASAPSVTNGHLYSLRFGNMHPAGSTR